ncbi:hypothetical protein [Flavobacterium rhizosphaerae]|uniref:Uncharacterized protein n=1 Tax=Flavobacterium rhizosphaerae TaxID=3163298 RepID=A0ABW8Z085_9FLAO
MTITIRLRVPKDIDAATERKIRRLTGSLIAQSFTDIIHFDDDGEDFYIHYFTTLSIKKEDTITFISSFLSQEALSGMVTLL